MEWAIFYKNYRYACDITLTALIITSDKRVWEFSTCACNRCIYFLPVILLTQTVCCTRTEFRQFRTDKTKKWHSENFNEWCVTRLSPLKDLYNKIEISCSENCRTKRLLENLQEHQIKSFAVFFSAFCTLSSNYAQVDCVSHIFEFDIHSISVILGVSLLVLSE